MIVITGGSGYIGYFLYELLRKEKPLILDIVPPKSKEHNWKYCDIRDPLSISEVIKGATTVYHLAASADFRLANLNTRHVLETNVLGSVNVFRACLKHKIPVIYTSTQAIHDRPLTEYSLSKLEAEEYGRLLVRRGLQLKIARLGYVYTPMLRAGWVMSDLVEKIGRYKEVKIINSESAEAFTHVEDVSIALYAIKEYGEIGIPYEVSDTPTSIKDLAILVKKLVKSKSRLDFDKQGTISPYLRKDFKRARELSWLPLVGLEKGLSEAIKNRRWEQMKITDEDLERWKVGNSSS